MANSIWRWIKKGFVLELLMLIVGLVILAVAGITIAGLSAETFDIWIKQNGLITIIIFLVVHLIIKGWLIEKVNIWIK